MDYGEAAARPDYAKDGRVGRDGGAVLRLGQRDVQLQDLAASERSRFTVTFDRSIFS